MTEKQDEYSTFRVFMAEYKTLLTDKYIKSKTWRPPDKNSVLAVIPGTILDVRVKKGNLVKAGETLLILDAMKMENHITMPFDGKVRKVHVKKDDIVVKHQVLVEIDPQ